MSIVRDEAIRGFLLVDALVGLAIALLLAGILGSLVLYQNRQLGAETHRVFARQGLRSAVELMVDDLRSAGHRAPGVSYASSTSPPGLCTASSDLVRVTADLDGDGQTTGPGEDVTYCRCAGAPAGGGLYRAYLPMGGSSFVVERIADDVSSLQFTYGPRDVTVALTIAVSSPMGTYSQGDRSLVHFRNGPDQVSCAPGPTCPPAVCN